MDDLTSKVVCVLDEALTALDVQRNFLQLAAEECDHAGTDYDFNNQMNVLRACSYAERSAIMLSLIYTTADKADLIHNTLESIVKNYTAQTVAKEC